MVFWLYMLVAVLIIPVTMILLGRQYLHHAPGKINFLSGYRTSMSMKNPDTWAFAHHAIGKIWLIFGAVLLPVSAGLMLFVFGHGAGTVGTMGGVLVGLQLVLMAGSMLPVERGLKRTFDENGLRR